MARDDTAFLTRRCGFPFTTTGRPCENRVAGGAPWCRAGHPRTPAGDSDDVVFDALGGPVARAWSIGGATRRRPDFARRATALLGHALSSDDAELLGTRAEHILVDEGAALMLLGSPTASEVARVAVVQRFGLVGAYLVVGYEERWRHWAEDKDAVRPVSSSAAFLEALVRDVAHVDARRLDRLLGQIDGSAASERENEVARAHRWLHATYAVAARDGTAASHRSYLRALERVLRLVGPLVLP